MKSANFGAPGSAPGAFSVSPTAENYWEEYAAYCYCVSMWNLSAAGITMTQSEVSDFTAYNTLADTWLDDANDRFDAWLQGAVGEAIGNVPDVLQIGAAFVSGGASEVGVIILSKILNHMFHVEDSRAQYEGAHENIDMDAIVAKLEEVRAEIETTLSEFNINIFLDEYQQSWSVGPVEPD